MNTRTDWVESTTNSNLFYSKEETIADVISNFDTRRFYSAEGKSVTIDTTIEQVIIQDHSNPINENKYTKKMLIPNDSVATSGSYVSYDNATWLIVSRINNIDDAYKTCQIQQCNYTLKFQHPTTGIILSYPCIDDTSSSVGIDENNTISTINNIHRIKLPFDDSTKLIKIDDRFFLDRVGTTTYKTTNVNNTEFSFGSKGIIELTLQADGAYNLATDINGVCNYKEPTTPPTPTPSGYTLTISSSGDFAMGATRTLIPVLKDGSSNIVAIDSINWVVDYNGMTQSYFTITYVGNQCIVMISDADEMYNYISEKVLKLSCTATYTVNGITSTVDGVYSDMITAN